MLVGSENRSSINFNGEVFLKKTPFNIFRKPLPTTILEGVKKGNLLGELTEDFVAIESKRKELNLNQIDKPYWEDTKDYIAKMNLKNRLNKFSQKLLNSKFIDNDGNWTTQGIPNREIVVSNPLNSSDKNTTVKKINAFSVVVNGGELEDVHIDGARVLVNGPHKIKKLTGRNVTLNKHNGSDIKAAELNLKKGSTVKNSQGGKLTLEDSHAVNVKFKTVLAKGSSTFEHSNTNKYYGKNHSVATANRVTEIAEMTDFAQIHKSQINLGNFKLKSKGSQLKFYEINATNSAEIKDSKGTLAYFLGDSKPKGVKTKKMIVSAKLKKIINSYLLNARKIKRLSKMTSNRVQMVFQKSAEAKAKQKNTAVLLQNNPSGHRA